MHTAKSPSDPAQVGLKFQTKELAQQHADRMNELIDTFDTDHTWNKSYWKTKPEPWVVI